MNIKVNSHTLEINQNIDINTGEYNITTLNFEFSDEYEGLTKMAVFSNCETSIKTAILNNQCTIPFEVLEEPGQVLLGVYGYEGEDDSLELRYSPEPQYFNVKHGSYQEGGEPTIPPKSEWEEVVEEVNQAIDEANNLNITANKEGKVTTVTITKKDGTTQEVEINDGKDLEFNWEGTSLGVRQEGQSEYEYTNLKGAKGDTGATPNIQIGDVQTGDSSEVTRTGTDENPILNFTLEKGDTGNGIASIAKTSTSGLVDTYTITFTNGQTTTFEVTNGANGDVVDVQVDGTSVVDNGVANIILAEMKQELEDMYNLLPKVSGTGETITLDGTVAGKMLIDLKGNTLQNGTPTPESPQDIHVVSGDNTIEVCGKNLLPTNSLTPTYNTTTTLIDFGKDKTFDSVTLSFIFNGSYSQVTNVAMFDLRTNDNTHNYLTPDTFGLIRDTNYTNQQLNTTKTNVTFRYLIVYFMTNNYNNFSANSTMTNIQLEKSSTATPYEAYKSASYPITLPEGMFLGWIGTYQDRIFKNTPNTTDYDSNLEDNVWYLKKEIGKKDFTTSDFSNMLTSYSRLDYVGFQKPIDSANKGNSNDIPVLYTKGTYAKIVNFNSLDNLNKITSSGGYNLFYLGVTKGTTDVEGQAIIEGSKMYYPLATPTYTEITDSTLISQLNALARSYLGQTNITQTNNDLPFIINATALKEMA